MENPKTTLITFQARETLKDLSKKSGEHFFDDKINTEILKHFFSNLAKELVNKLPNPSCKCGKENVKQFYIHLKRGRKTLYTTPYNWRECA